MSSKQRHNRGAARVGARTVSTPAYDPDAVCLGDMPQEVLLHIFTFLFVEDLLNIGAVCREFRAISKDNNLANNYRRNVNVSFIGSSLAGKSTLVGHLHLLLEEAKQSDIREAKAVAKDAQAMKLGPHAKYAQYTFLSSRRKLDRQRGLTSDNNYLHVLGSRHPLGFTLIDTPGHRDYFKNTLRGFLQSDMAVWVVDEIPSPGDAYLRSHSFHEAALMIAGANMKCAVVAVNKMDQREWSTSKFDEMKIKLAQALVKRRIKTDNIIIVPVNAADGWNIVHRTVVASGREMPEDIRVTYQGLTLWEAILQLAPKTPKRPPKKPFRMSVIKMWNTVLVPGEKQRGVVLGTVVQGGLKVNQKIRLSPAPASWLSKRGEQEVAVWGIGAGKLKRTLAPPGYLSALILPRGTTISDQHKRGQDGTGWVAYNSGKEAEYAAETRYFIAQVMLFAGSSINPALPPATKFKILPGYTPIFHFVSGSFMGRVVAIHNAIDNKTRRVAEQAPKFASGGAGKMFTMTIMSKVPHTIEPYASNATFGRFFIADNNVLVGAGIVTVTVPSRMSPSFERVKPAVTSKFAINMSCDECYLRPPATVAFVFPTPPKAVAAKQRRMVCANCFFDYYSQDPHIGGEHAYCP